MKTKLLPYCLAIAFLFTSCHKSTVVKGVVYHGRIINSICGQITVQFTDNNKLGENKWEDQSQTYDHVFKVENPCNWNPDGVIISSEFKFILAGYTIQNCAQCMALGHTPSTAYSIQVVK